MKFKARVVGQRHVPIFGKRVIVEQVVVEIENSLGFKAEFPMDDHQLQIEIGELWDVEINVANAEIRFIRPIKVSPRMPRPVRRSDDPRNV